MVTCPTLGRVPGVVQDDLRIKASSNGVTFLTKTRFRQRYTGSKQSAVDINGKLYLQAKELRKALMKEAEGKAKKNRAAVKQTRKFSPSEPKDTNIISTENADLSPKEKKILTYSIHKTQVRHRILGYLNTQKGKKELYFWTVSFPEKTPDDTCYRVLNIWLTQLRKKKMLKDYVRITERQKNGTIHYHLAIPHRMDVFRANSIMRITLRTLAIKGEIPFTPMQCYKYNGVDIAKDRKTKRVINFAQKKKARALAHYLTKYVTKNDEKFTHLAWHNSRGYSQVFTGVTFTIAEFTKQGFGYYLDRRKKREMEFAVFIPWIEEMPPPIRDHLYQLNSYIQSQLN